MTTYIQSKVAFPSTKIATNQAIGLADFSKVFLKGAYYVKPRFELHHANCLDFLATLPENSVDMVFADPPYLLSNGGFTVHAGRQVSVNKGAWDKSNGLKYEIII